MYTSLILLFPLLLVSKIVFYLLCSTLVPFLLDLFFLTLSTFAMFTNSAAILVNENK